MTACLRFRLVGWSSQGLFGSGQTSQLSSLVRLCGCCALSTHFCLWIWLSGELPKKGLPWLISHVLPTQAARRRPVAPVAPSLAPDPVVLPPEPPAPVLHGPPRRPRVERGEPWGIFSVADIARDGIRVGWGATCGLHTNRGDLATCKKTLSLGRDLTNEQCIVQLKRWLLRGLEIPENGSHSARLQHGDVDARFECAIGTHPTLLDAERDRLLALWSERESARA